jgi:hypothetical protein
VRKVATLVPASPSFTTMDALLDASTRSSNTSGSGMSREDLGAAASAWLVDCDLVMREERKPLRAGGALEAEEEEEEEEEKEGTAAAGFGAAGAGAAEGTGGGGAGLGAGAEGWGGVERLR